MKNKIILVFLIFIFNSGYLNFLSAEEFKFDTTELQVTENGNLIKKKCKIYPKSDSQLSL